MRTQHLLRLDNLYAKSFHATVETNLQIHLCDSDTLIFAIRSSDRSGIIFLQWIIFLIFVTKVIPILKYFLSLLALKLSI